MDNDILRAVLDYIWVPIVTVVGIVWGKLVGLDVRAQLLEQAEAHHQTQRVEENKLRDEQRKEILDRIDKHHTMVMSKLDAVETRVKNGH